MKFRITVRGDGTELRGYMVALDHTTLNAFAATMKPYGMVVASIADDDYDPFADQQMVAAVAATVADNLEKNWEHGDLAGSVHNAIAFLREVAQRV
jgi:hypothetical protein